MSSPNPCFVFLPKHLIRKKSVLPEKIEAVPFGKGRIKREGTGVTLVTWGNCVELSLEAASKLEQQEISVEVIDLLTVQPWDKDLVAKSLEKTGHLVVVQEDGISCSVGDMIIREMTTGKNSFYSFISHPILVSKPDVHIGYNPVLEFEVLPGVDDIVEACEVVIREG